MSETGPDRDLSVIEAIGIWSAATDEADDEAMRAGYARSVRTKFLFIIVCTVLLLVSVVCAVGFGPYDIGFFRSIRIMCEHLLGDIEDPIFDYFVWEGRLPRALMGALTGIGLAVGGCVMQSILNNDLADSYTTGIVNETDFFYHLYTITAYQVHGPE